MASEDITAATISFNAPLSLYLLRESKKKSNKYNFCVALSLCTFTISLLHQDYSDNSPLVINRKRTNNRAESMIQSPFPKDTVSSALAQ
jgi:hypothetical protein